MEETPKNLNISPTRTSTVAHEEVPAVRVEAGSGRQLGLAGCLNYTLPGDFADPKHKMIQGLLWLKNGRIWVNKQC